LSNFSRSALFNGFVDAKVGAINKAAVAKSRIVVVECTVSTKTANFWNSGLPALMRAKCSI
jgi:hypothetical protein